MTNKLTCSCGEQQDFVPIAESSILLPKKRGTTSFGSENDLYYGVREYMCGNCGKILRVVCASDRGKIQSNGNGPFGP